jgi:hypothetical protein
MWHAENLQPLAILLQPGVAAFANLMAVGRGIAEPSILLIIAIVAVGAATHKLWSASPPMGEVLKQSLVWAGERLSSDALHRLSEEIRIADVYLK